MRHLEERFVAVIAFIAAGLIASHDFSSEVSQYFFIGYIYWIVRIAVESAFFFGVRSAIEYYSPKEYSLFVVTILSIIISHIPFVLSVTALDIVLGYPELGLTDASEQTSSRIMAFGFELFYLLDNHIWLCLLLTLPRMLIRFNVSEVAQVLSSEKKTLLSSIDPPLKGDVIWVEAQEHYVRITTEQENRMVLARFSDITRELGDKIGMQVHRSHWIRQSAISKYEKRGQSVFVVLSSGDEVPVSRSYRHLIKQ